LLCAVLLALVVRTVFDGPNLPVALTEAVVALLLLAAGKLWRYGRELRPDTSAADLDSTSTV
jgi:hypothetical protein